MAGFVELLRHQFDQNADRPAIIYHLLHSLKTEQRALERSFKIRDWKKAIG
jgi:hypothetical protein